MNATTAVAVDGKPKLLDRVRNALRVRHLAQRVQAIGSAANAKFNRVEHLLRHGHGA